MRDAGGAESRVAQRHARHHTRQHALRTRAGGGGDALRLLGPRNITLRQGSTDFDVFLQVYCSTDSYYVKDLVRFLPPDGRVTVLDAGANVGLVSVLFAQLTRLKGLILAVDAMPATVEVLKENTLAYHGRVIPVNAAIVTQPDAAAHPTMNVSGPTDQFWAVKVEHEFVNYSSRVVSQVPTTTLKRLTSQVPSGRFDWVKIDVEGEERKLLMDPESREVLCDASCLFMELHDWMVPGCKASFNAFVSWGCPGKGAFVNVTQTGEYTLLCKQAMVALGQ